MVTQTKNKLYITDNIHHVIDYSAWVIPEYKNMCDHKYQVNIIYNTSYIML